MSKIFIQIASYRDPQLIPTLDDCISNADNPENLVFSIAWQHNKEDIWDNLDKYKDDLRFKIIDIDYKESDGACWARNLIQQQYDGEEYTLQLDSHHRFVKGWDTICIEMLDSLKKLGIKKPLLTSYLSVFLPSSDPESRVMEPYKMDFDEIIPEGAIFFMPSFIPNWQEMDHPIPAKFYSAHFCFTQGSFCHEVQHNPNYLFHGEEISIAVRAFTHGYDLFHPHRVIAWHEYTRIGRVKNWDDDKLFHTKNERSHSINRKLFGMNDPSHEDIEEKYGFGKERTLRDYEEYSGILFSERKIQPETFLNLPPPNRSIMSHGGKNSWLKNFKHHSKREVRIKVDELELFENGMVAIIYEDINNNPLHREDLNTSDFLRYKQEDFFSIKRNLITDSIVTRLVVWPYSTEKWGTKVERTI